MLFCSYFILWFRTFTVFYRKNKTRQLTKKWARYVHFITFPLLIAVITSILAMQWTTPTFISNNCTCFEVAVTDRSFLMFSLTYYILCTLFFNAAFVFSFVYPLHLHRKKLRHSRINQGDYIMPVAARAAKVGAILVVNDSVIFLVLVFSLIPAGSPVYHMLISISLLVRVLTIIMSFANWRRRSSFRTC